MKTFSKVTKLRFKDKLGKVEVYRLVQVKVDDKVSYSIYLEVGAKTYLQFSTDDIDQFNEKYQQMLRDAKQQQKRYQVCKIL